MCFYILTNGLLKYNRLSLKMTLIRFGLLLVLLTAGCGFVKNCQNFNPANFALCSLCLPDFYLGNGKCYPCPANRNTIRECSSAASPQAATVANATNLTQEAQAASSNGSNSSASGQQSKKQESSTVTGAIVLSNKNEPNNNASSNNSNSSNTTTINTTNITNSSTTTNSTPSNNTTSNNSSPSNSSQNSTTVNNNQRVDFTQMIFNYLPAHCCEFKLVPVLACSACEKNYVLVNDTCIPSPPPPTAQNTSSQKETTQNATASIIPAGLKVTSSLTTNTDNTPAPNAFIPIISPPPNTSQNFFIPVAPQFLPATTPTTTSPSNTTVVMPQKEPITDSNCLTRNPQFSLSKPVSEDNQRCSNCYSGFFYSLAKEQCLPLNPLCKTADTQNRCLTCYMGYIPSKGSCVLDNGQGVTQTTTSSTPVKIQQIDPNCQKYEENSSVCAICANRYYFSITKGLCVQVDTSCKTWDTVKGYCLTCYTGYTCNANEYVCKPIVVPTTTTPSDPNSFKKYCLKTRNNICVSCAFRSFLSNGLCLPVSDLCQTFNPNFGYCLSCYSGYTLNNGICEQDQILNPDPNCASYNYNTNTCNQCNYNYYSNNGWCQMVSPFCNGYDPTSGFCLDCISIYNLDPQTGICS